MLPTATPKSSPVSRPRWTRSLALLLLPALMASAAHGAPRTKQSPPNAPLVPLDMAAPAVTLPYTQTFNAPLSGWTLSGKWHVRQNPQTTSVSDYILDKDLVQLPDNGRWPSAYEGTGVLVYSDDEVGLPGEGTFVAPWDTMLSEPGDGGISNEPVEGDAVLPQLDLTGLTDATLSIWTWFEIESVDPAPDQFDAMLVQASTDGTNFMTVGWAGPAVDYDGNPDQPASSGGFNLPGKWVRQVYDLSDYAGQNIWLRLRFQSNDALYNAFRGWFVDSLAVTANSLPDCTIESVNPTTVAQGGPFLITGTNFVQGSTVEVGGQPAAVQSTANTTLIEAVAPFSLADGTYDVKVTAPNGSSCTLPNSLEVKAGTMAGCSVLQALPFCLPSSDGTQQVVIWGQGFQPGSVALVGGTSVTPTYQDAQLIVFTLPALANDFYEVKVRTPQGTECNASAFLIVDPTICTTTPCTIASMSPTCVKPGQGVTSRVTLAGTSFGANPIVTVDGNSATVVSANSTQIVFEPPSLPDGIYLVQVAEGTNICLAPRLLQLTGGSCSVATERTTWGRVKASYR